jgi:hypothetical protein
MSGQIQFTVDASAVSGHLQDKQLGITAALMERTTAINTALQAKIAGEKLAGEVLNQRSGKLAGSVRVTETTLSGATISGGVQAGGGVAWYGKLHEYGGTFERKAGSVRLRLDVKGELMRQLKNGNLAVFAKKSHTRVKEVATAAGTITFPVRSFMRSTLEEERENIITQLQDAAKEGSA